uniref:Tudor domain-containing protein n=2 Tax=Rhodnius prolixus TaxID=13249 RepID=T1H9T9_RHOPR
MSDRHIWMNMQLNRQPNVLIKLSQDKWKIGTKCIAHFTEAGQLAYYRTVILNVDMKLGLAQVFYIDYGNEMEIKLEELMDYSEHLINCGIKDEPPLAIECTLAEIQPSARLNPKGYWSKDSISVFSNYFEDKSCIALIYSIVGNVMSVTLFKPEKLEKVDEFSHNLSFNHEFVERGFAEMAEEPYLSRENHVMRTMAQKSPEALKLYTPSYLPDDPYAHFQFEPPSEKECQTKVLLKGPKSPLEMSLYSLSKKCLGKEVQVEWNSVNSVLLDNVPMDTHDRLMVAAHVTQSSSSDRLTLRNTTLLPNMHGLPSLMVLLFAPKVELRTDPEREELTGALCGLGFDPESGDSYHPENDVEIMFDTKFNLEDLENINKLRFWMNFIVGDALYNNLETCSPRIIQAQRKIKEYLLILINKKRPSRAQTMFDNSFAWDQLPQDVLLDPLGPKSSSSTSIYSLIWGVELSSGPKFSKIEAIKSHLELLQGYSDGADVMRTGTKCELCQVYVDDLQALRLHLQTNLHKTNLIQFSCTFN